MKSKYEMFTHLASPGDIIYTVNGPEHVKDEKIMFRKGWNLNKQPIYSVRYVEPLSYYEISHPLTWFDEWKVVTNLTSLKKRSDTLRRLPLKQHVNYLAHYTEFDLGMMI